LLFTLFGLSSCQTIVVYFIWFVFLPQTIVVYVIWFVFLPQTIVVYVIWFVFLPQTIVDSLWQEDKQMT
jgi:phage shock protein PspC (stress-responsive transcriptional regulator)